MFIDATGSVHFEFWEGIKLNGKRFQSVPLFEMCRTYGDLTVTEACRNLGCYPYAADLATIKEECERIESNYI